MHLSQIACIAEFDLTQRGDSWFYLTKILQTRVVSGQFVQEIRSFRSRTDDGHRPCKYIEELGGLIQFVSSHESSPFRNSRIIRYSQKRSVSFRICDHASELIHCKALSVFAQPFLFENNGSL